MNRLFIILWYLFITEGFILFSMTEENVEHHFPSKRHKKASLHNYSTPSKATTGSPNSPQEKRV